MNVLRCTLPSQLDSDEGPSPAFHMFLCAALACAASNPASAQSTTRMSVDSNGAEGDAQSGFTYSSISADGRYVAFESWATTLVPGDTNNWKDTFVRDRQTGQTVRVSVHTSGAQGNSDSAAPSISADGRYVAFWSFASNLVTGDTNGVADVFVRDVVAGITTRVSVDSAGLQGNSFSQTPSISADGRYLVFESLANNLVPGDTNGAFDVFVRDRTTGTTTRVSVDSTGAEANGGSGTGLGSSISADGRYIAFSSSASNLVRGDANNHSDIFVRDTLTSTTTCVSLSTLGAQGDDNSVYPSISEDGRFVAFNSYATNLVTGDTNGLVDVFVHSLITGVTTRVSVDSLSTQGNSASQFPAISADGRFVAFQSQATNLVLVDVNGAQDIFLRDNLTNETSLLSLDSLGLQANSFSTYPSISSDGRYVAFNSGASNLVGGDTNGHQDIFLRDRGELPAYSACFGDGSSGPCPCGNNGLLGKGCQNSASTGGAALTSAGLASLGGDTLVFTSAGELPNAFSIFLQGSTAIDAASFGDGLRCVGGTLKRLFVHPAVVGIVSAPQGSDLSVSARSAALGAVIPTGATRFYQTYYRDPNPSFCAAPIGATWTVSSSLAIVWSP